MFSKNKILIIAEMAASHEGIFSNAKKIIEETSKTGADAIKFQKFTADELAEKNHPDYTLYKQQEMSETQWKQLITFAKRKKLLVFADVFGLKSAKTMAKLNIDGFKIHSSDILNPELLEFVSKQKKPIFLSTAGSSPNEIDESLKVLAKNSNEIALLHGFQGFPTKTSDLNLKRISTLAKRYCLPVGLMDHISGESKMAKILPLLGIGMGATIIEKHITLDRSKKGEDYFSSLNPDEFKEMVSLIRTGEKTLGSSELTFSKNELKYRLNHKKHPIAKRFIKKGTLLTKNMFEFKRTKLTTESIPFYDFVGKKAEVNIPENTILTNKHISKHKIAAVIACRNNSSRMYGKPLQPIDGKSLLDLQLNAIKTSKLIDDVILAISDTPGNEIFVDYARKNNLKFYLGDDIDVLKRNIEAAKYVGADTIVRFTPDDPYPYWEDIDIMLKKHLDGNYDMTDSFEPPIGSGCQILSLKALEKSHKQGSKKHRSELVALYIFENVNKFKIYTHNLGKKLSRPELRFTVDTPEDLIVAREIFRALGKNGKPIRLEKIISFLDSNPNIRDLNAEIPLGVSVLKLGEGIIKNPKKR